MVSIYTYVQQAAHEKVSKGSDLQFKLHARMLRRKRPPECSVMMDRFLVTSFMQTVSLPPRLRVQSGGVTVYCVGSVQLLNLKTAC